MQQYYLSKDWQDSCRSNTFLVWLTNIWILRSAQQTLCRVYLTIHDDPFIYTPSTREKRTRLPPTTRGIFFARKVSSSRHSIPSHHLMPHERSNTIATEISHRTSFCILPVTTTILGTIVVGARFRITSDGSRGSKLNLGKYSQLCLNTPGLYTEIAEDGRYRCMRIGAEVTMTCHWSSVRRVSTHNPFGLS